MFVYNTESNFNKHSGFSKLSKVLSIISIMPENEVGPNIALYASPTSRNSTILILTVPIHTTLFLPMLFKGEVFCVRTGRWRIGLLGLVLVYNLINCLGCVCYSTVD